jgi:hypothetical protein
LKPSDPVPPSHLTTAGRWSAGCDTLALPFGPDRQRKGEPNGLHIQARAGRRHTRRSAKTRYRGTELERRATPSRWGGTGFFASSTYVRGTSRTKIRCSWSNPLKAGLTADHDKADGHSFDEALLRCGVGRARLDEPFLFFRTNRNDDFVRRKSRKSVADGETDVRLPGTSIDCLAGKSIGRAFSDPLRMTERFLVVGQPVEHALPYDRHYDLDRVGLPDMRAQCVVCMFDGADDEDVLAHDGKRTARRPPKLNLTPDWSAA